jgi:hypothetical protein
LWLDLSGPLVARELARRTPIPPRLLRLTEFRSIAGYAAFIHMVLFIAAMLSHSFQRTPLSVLLTPFLTPFGLLLAAALLHTLLYWVMLVGTINDVTRSLASDVSSGAWTILRLTPYSVTQLIVARLTAIRYSWQSVLITLIVTRVLASAVVPLSAAADTHFASNADLISVVGFILQPAFEFFAVCGLATLAAFLVPQPFWARMLGYAMVSVVFGALSFLTVTFAILAQMGPIATALVPLNHWTLLALAVAPNPAQSVYTVQVLLTFGTTLLLPTLVGGLALVAATYLGKRT